MGLETVISEVEQGGQRRADAIIEAAKAEAGDLLAGADAKAVAYAEQRSAQAKRDAEQIRGQAISHAEFEGRKTVLEAEAELREQLRATVLEGFAGFSRPLRDSHLEKLVKNAQAIIPKGKVWGAAKDKDVLSATDYKFAGTVDIAGGLIVEDTQGKVRLDLSYDTLLEDLWRDILRSEADLFR